MHEGCVGIVQLQMDQRETESRPLRIVRIAFVELLEMLELAGQITSFRDQQSIPALSD